jgi:AcrR family transcriptional regulator
MSQVSTRYEEGGRSQQKRRTRAALVAAARDLVAAGRAVTVEDAAAAASISRTTAYRYFRTRRALLLAAHPEVERASLLPESAPDDARARLDAVVDAFTAMIVDTEAQQRTMLRLSLDRDTDADLPLRQGRAIGWIEDALAPLRTTHPDIDVHRLAVAIRSATGIETLIWLTDIAGYPRAAATGVMRWSARAMLEAALAGMAP